MKLASQVQRTGMYLNDKELSSWRLQFPGLHGFHGETLDYFGFMCASVHKKHDCLLSWNYVSAFNGRDKGLPKTFSPPGLSRAAITVSAEIFYILLIRR